MLLLQVRYRRNFNKIQKLYLLTLSANEMLTNLLRIFEKIFEKEADFSFNLRRFRQGFLVSQLYMVMIMLTLDRLLFIRLHIYYDLYITSWRTRGILMFLTLISTAITLVFFATQKNMKMLNYNLTIYFWTISDVAFLVTAFITYFYIRQYLKQHARSLHTTAAVIYRRRTQRAMLVPKLIILSFITAWIGGDLIYLSFVITNTRQPDWLRIVLNFMFVTAYSVDAIFYTLFCRQVRLLMIHKFRSIKTVSVKKSFLS